MKELKGGMLRQSLITLTPMPRAAPVTTYEGIQSSTRLIGLKKINCSMQEQIRAAFILRLTASSTSDRHGQELICHIPMCNRSDTSKIAQSLGRGLNITVYKEAS